MTETKIMLLNTFKFSKFLVFKTTKMQLSSRKNRYVQKASIDAMIDEYKHH